MEVNPLYEAEVGLCAEVGSHTARCEPITGKPEVMQTSKAAAFARMPLRRPSPTIPALAIPSTAA